MSWRACRRFAILALGGAGLSAPPLPAQGAAVRFAVERYTLPNGLTVVLSPDPTQTTAAVHVRYRVGSRDEPTGQMGFAHLFEHVMFTGSAHAPNGLFDRIIRGGGGFSNGFTNHDVTGYFETVNANHLERVLWIEADRMGFLLPTLDSARFLAQRDVVKNERRLRMDGAYGRVDEIILWAMYPPPHPHGWFPAGYMPDLDGAKLNDIRTFFRTWYAPSNAVLVVAGGFDPAVVRRQVAHWFGGLRGAPAPKRVAVPPSPLRGEVRLTYEDEVSVPQLAIRWPTVGITSPDQAALDVVASVLSQTQHSRLDQELVIDRRIASRMTAGQVGFEWTGDFRIMAMAAPGQGLTVSEAAIDSVIARFKREGPTADEMAMARAILTQNWVAGLETPNGRANVLALGAVQGHDPDYHRTYLARLQRMTAAQVRDAAVRHLGGRRVVLSTVPKGKRDLAAYADRSRVVTMSASGVGYDFGGAR